MSKSRSKAPANQAKNKPSPQQVAALKEFRHNIAVLKRKGLVASTVDARTVKPSKALKQRASDFRDVIEGKARVWKTKDRASFKRLIGLGERGFNGRIVLPKEEYLAKDQLPTRTVNGVKVKRQPQVKTTLEEYIRQQTSGGLKDGQAWAFEIAGNESYMTFYDVSELIRTINAYQTVPFYRRNLSKRVSEAELIKLFRIIKVDKFSYGEKQAARPRPAKRSSGRAFIENMPLDLRGKMIAKKRGNKRSRVRGK
jgi:hypothetical protein